MRAVSGTSGKILSDKSLWNVQRQGVHHTHVPSLTWKEQHSPRRKFHSFSRDLSLALGGIRNTGTWAGGHPFDLQIRRIPAGAAVCPFHAHLAQWELFVVQSGVGTIRVGDETHLAKSGDVFVHPPGEAHQLTNHGTDDLEVLIIADHPALDAFHYPDSNKWGLRPPGKYFRMELTDYFDGEEEPLLDAPPYQPSPAPPDLPRLPFSKRLLNFDALPWDEWISPRKKFRGFSKEISIALGAERNKPTGFGGHPFELELQRLAPGDCGCPFHSHAGQWELYVILSGEARVRAGEVTQNFGSGDVILHPPREAHQITNASSSEDLLFYVVADNPSVDFCYYPDSDKWALLEPRKFFRAQDADFYEGEE